MRPAFFYERNAWENLFDTEFACIREGSWVLILWWWILFVMKSMFCLFAGIREHPGRSRKRIWIAFGVVISSIGVKSTVGQILLGHDESGPMLGPKLLVGPRWREFHCLAALAFAWSIACGL